LLVLEGAGAGELPNLNPSVLVKGVELEVAAPCEDALFNLKPPCLVPGDDVGLGGAGAGGLPNWKPPGFVVPAVLDAAAAGAAPNLNTLFLVEALVSDVAGAAPNVKPPGLAPPALAPLDADDLDPPKENPVDDVASPEAAELATPAPPNENPLLLIDPGALVLAEEAESFVLSFLPLLPPSSSASQASHVVLSFRFGTPHAAHFIIFS